ncbi:hypothetical protein GX645_04640 [Candidatus Sumerlaeota bacterium]|nr:hypothetical protein [Candidatus Sumerlaeota bacterium]
MVTSLQLMDIEEQPLEYSFDIVCVYNNKQVLDDVFLPYYINNKNDALFRLHPVDNRQNIFESAVEAFNSVLPECLGKWILFSHQDVALLSEHWLEQCADMLYTLSNWAVAGVAGMVPEGETNEQRGRSVVRTGVSLEVQEWWPWGNEITASTKVQTVDELLFIIPRALLQQLPFDGSTCDSWHLYAVDYSLSAKEALGLDTYVLPLLVYHQSSGIRKKRLQIVLSLGPLPHSYYKTLRKVLIKHRSAYKFIFTTCSHWHTGCPLVFQRIWKLTVGFYELILRKFRHMFSSAKTIQ